MEFYLLFSFQDTDSVHVVKNILSEKWAKHGQ